MNDRSQDYKPIINPINDTLFKALHIFLQKHLTTRKFNEEELFDTLMNLLKPDSKNNEPLTIKKIVDALTQNLNYPNQKEIINSIRNDSDSIVAMCKEHGFSMDSEKGNENILIELIYFCLSRYTNKFALPHSKQQHKQANTTKGREKDAEDLWNKLKTYHKIIVAGELGSGKSHFIKYCLKIWGIKDYCYINYDNQNDIKTNLHQVKYRGAFDYEYMGSDHELRNNNFFSSLLIIDDMYISSDFSEELAWLSKLCVDIIIITTSPIENKLFYLFKLPSLGKENLLQIFLEESGLSVPDTFLLESMLAKTMYNPLMISLIAKQCKNKIEHSPTKNPAVTLSDILNSLEYPDIHLGNSKNSSYRFKHESTGYEKSLNILGHIKSIYIHSFANAAPILHNYMKWLSCFGNAKLPLEFIPHIIPDYNFEDLKTLYNMGLIMLTENHLQLSTLISRAAFAVEMSVPIEKNLKDIPDLLLTFLRNYDSSLSVPYLSNSLFIFVQTFYKRIPCITNRKCQNHTSKEFEKWQDLVYLVYQYYNQTGDFFIAHKLISTIQYPEDLINAHCFLDTKFFDIGNNMQLIPDRQEMVKQIDNLTSTISKLQGDITDTIHLSYFLTNLMDLIMALFILTSFDKLISNNKSLDTYQKLLIDAMDQLRKYTEKNPKTSISSEALQYYQYINENIIYSFNINLTQVKKWENKNYCIRCMAFILLMQSLYIHWFYQYKVETKNMIPLWQQINCFISEIEYLSYQIRECKLIPYETFRLCFYLYISIAAFKKNTSVPWMLSTTFNPNNLYELLCRSFLSNDEVKTTINNILDFYPFLNL